MCIFHGNGGVTERANVLFVCVQLTPNIFSLSVENSEVEEPNKNNSWILPPWQVHNIELSAMQNSLIQYTTSKTNPFQGLSYYLSPHFSSQSYITGTCLSSSYIFSSFIFSKGTLDFSSWVVSCVTFKQVTDFQTCAQELSSLSSYVFF